MNNSDMLSLVKAAVNQRILQALVRRGGSEGAKAGEVLAQRANAQAVNHAAARTGMGVHPSVPEGMVGPHNEIKRMLGLDGVDRLAQRPAGSIAPKAAPKVAPAGSAYTPAPTPAAPAPGAPKGFVANLADRAGKGIDAVTAGAAKHPLALAGIATGLGTAGGYGIGNVQGQETGAGKAIAGVQQAIPQIWGGYQQEHPIRAMLAKLMMGGDPGQMANPLISQLIQGMSPRTQSAYQRALGI